MKKIIISVFTILSLLLSMVATPALASSVSLNDTTKKNPSDGIGRIDISSVISSASLPDYETELSGTYTYSGKVLIGYKAKSDVYTTDYYNIATVNDDGTGFKLIFSGVIPTKAKANGVRYMPFRDNKRVLLGDYVLECTPNIDNCTSAKIVPIEFPPIIEEDPNTTHTWSEIIIAPDNKHMSWTSLRSDIGAIAAIGVLDRKEDNYVIENPQLISTVPYFESASENNTLFDVSEVDKTTDAAINVTTNAAVKLTIDSDVSVTTDDAIRIITDVGEEYIIPNILRGGEVKQFIHGGNSISIVGQKLYSTTDSIIQDLKSNKLTQITYTPGYDETTIFSPDERLGMVMSTRFSKKTDPAIFGLMPRPYGSYTSMGINSILYTYSVTGVRKSREGNIGPALVDINRSMKEKGYKGISLNTDENWVYYSPMSWSPNGKSAMWVEGLRGDSSQMRLQKVNLLDYKPKKTVPFETTTDNIPYAQDLSVLDYINPNIEGKIVGKHSGYINYVRNISSVSQGKTETEYVNYSDDGINFYNGYEKINYNYGGESCYEANIELTGKEQGEMDLKATFSALGGNMPAKLLFDTDTDGNPKSYGYVRYNGVKLNIKDLSK